MSILEEIRKHKIREVAERKELYPVKLLERSMYFKERPVSLRKYLLRKDLCGIIAEFKRQSPSRGVINRYARAAEVCHGYMQAGASALSVLTDTKYFGGSADDLQAARKFNYCPILRKDFILDEYQIIEARSMGADVVLLIAALLDKKEMHKLAKFAVSLGMEVLAEFHSHEELGKLNPYIQHVGVNNRDLKTFDVNLTTAYELAEHIPDDFIKIAESGIEEATTVFALRKAGYHGFLIGEYFMRQPDPAAACARFIQDVRNYENIRP
ncbi:MAG: indole-3-glycerol phosphate synthase [Chitinophagales bacterium]|nr:MAG: indole-3-glycerol phosphate synthase [Chitinophagales bacterium]